MSYCNRPPSEPPIFFITNFLSVQILQSKKWYKKFVVTANLKLYTAARITSLVAEFKLVQAEIFWHHRALKKTKTFKAKCIIYANQYFFFFFKFHQKVQHSIVQKFEFSAKKPKTKSSIRDFSQSHLFSEMLRLRW